MKKLPQHGLSEEEIFATLEAYRAHDLSWRDGRTWAYVYDPGEKVEAVIKRAYMSFLSENGLDPTAFPSLLQLENEVVSMAASHLGGDEKTVGNFTSGGTESIILAVKAARDWARANRPEIKQPEMVLPDTAHAAFHKAAHYLDVKPVVVKVDPETFRADVEAMRAAITQNTILLVGSAISYAHGVVDPIEELGQLALEKELLFHVDGCMGGFLLPYFKRLGGDVPNFDLSVPGVTSISMDLHKYAFAAKGASVILYKDPELRKYQIYACSQWTGYTIVNPTVQSSKSGGPLAAAWAVLHFIGDDGYMEMARTMFEATQRVIKGIEAIEGLKILGKPNMNLLCFTTTDHTNVFHIADEMKLKGWCVQPQLGYNHSKENIHLSINPNNAQWVDALLEDLRDSVNRSRAREAPPAAAMIQELFKDFDPNQLDDEVLEQLLGMVGAEGDALPERMAEINDALNALPAVLRERLLTQYLNQLFHYKERA